LDQFSAAMTSFTEIIREFKRHRLQQACTAGKHNVKVYKIMRFRDINS